jgi:hypothetical protein
MDCLLWVGLAVPRRVGPAAIVASGQEPLRGQTLPWEHRTPASASHLPLVTRIPANLLPA